jgi:allantoin racemase
MRVLLINPNTTATMTEHMVDAATAACAADTTVVGATAADGVPFIDGYYDEALAAAAVARCVAGRRDGVDAMIVACFGDPGLYAARELTAVPIVGIAEASFALAMSLGHRFGIVATVDRAVPGTIDLLRRYGVESRCAAIEASGTEVLEIDHDPERTLAALEAAGRRAIAAGAEVLCLGCGAMVSTQLVLEQRLGVPIVEAVPAAVVLAESLVRLGLRTSKIRAFAPPATLAAT